MCVLLVLCYVVVHVVYACICMYPYMHTHVCARVSENFQYWRSPLDAVKKRVVSQGTCQVYIKDLFHTMVSQEIGIANNNKYLYVIPVH